MDWEGDDASSFLDSLDSGGGVLDVLPAPEGAGALAPTGQVDAGETKPAPKARRTAKSNKRARQNAQAQRNYRRREKEQKERAVTAAQDLQAYMNEAEQQLNEVLEIISSDPVIMERLMKKLPTLNDDTEEQITDAEAAPAFIESGVHTGGSEEGAPPSDLSLPLPPQKGSAAAKSDHGEDDARSPRDHSNPLLQHAATTARQMAETNQRLLLNLPGDRYIEGEIDALAALHKEVAQAKAEDDRAGDVRADKWITFVQIPSRYGKSMSDLLLCFVRWARQHEAVPPQPAGGSGSGTLDPPGPNALEEEPLFNVDRAFRKLCRYVEDINKFADMFGLTPERRDFAETYSLAAGSFVSRRQAVDGSTVCYSIFSNGGVKDSLRQGERGVRAACRGGTYGTV